MGFLTTGRLSASTHFLLAELAESDALITFVTAKIGGEPRFFFQRGLAHHLVPERSVDVLSSNRLIIRSASEVPIYRISDKGRAYLRITETRRRERHT